MTTDGEDGMVAINDKELWSKIWSYRDHDKSYDTVYHREHALGLRWLHKSLGTNWCVTEMQVVIGRIQLRRMSRRTVYRQMHAARLAESLDKSANTRLIEVADCIGHVQYRLYAFVKPEHLKEGWTCDRVVNGLNTRKIPCYQGSHSKVYLEKIFGNTPRWPKERLENAIELGNTSLIFLVHPTLIDGEIASCREHIEAVLAQVTT